MTTWASRARAYFLHKRQNSPTESPFVFTNECLKHTIESTETPISMVSVVPSGRFCEKHEFQNQGDLKASNQDHTPKLAAIDDPGRWCWPYSTAMTGGEMDTFAARLARFPIKGVIHADAESMADRLLQRDRENDDRRACLECDHLVGYGRASWRCGNWQAAGIAIHAHDNHLSGDFAQQLQRCDGFADTFTARGSLSAKRCLAESCTAPVQRPRQPDITRPEQSFQPSQED